MVAPGLPSGRHEKLASGPPWAFGDVQCVTLMIGSRLMVTAASAPALGSVGAMPGASAATGVNGAPASGAFASDFAAAAFVAPNQQ